RKEPGFRQVNGFVEEGFITATEEGQCTVTEDRNPQQNEAKWNEQHTEHKLAQGTAARNASQEEADEGSPRNPPCPEEQGPILHPISGRIVGVAIGVAEGVHHHGWEAAEEVAYILNQLVHQTWCVTGE